jgi:hypothetical protein
LELALKIICYIHTTYLDCFGFRYLRDEDYFEDMRINGHQNTIHVVLGGWLRYKAEGVVFTIGGTDVLTLTIYRHHLVKISGFLIDPTTLIPGCQ